MEKSMEKQKTKPVSWTYKERTENVDNGKPLVYVWIVSNAEPEDNASKYIFEVRRYKITTTKEEYLSVKVYEVERDEAGEISDYDECAEIEKVSIVDLESKLLNLRTYGVILERKHFPKIRQEIEKAYLKMTKRFINDSTTVTDEVIHSLYKYFAQFISDVRLDADNGFYNVPVTDFKEHIADSEFSKYKYADLRSGLAQLTIEVNGSSVNATKCSYGRTDNTVKVGNKLVKVISFTAEAIDNYQFTNLPEG